MRRQPEAALQIQVAQFLDAALMPPAFWFHVPNGERRDARTGARLKAMGTKPGVPDVLIFWLEHEEYSQTAMLAIELKSTRGKLSADQRRKLSQFEAVRARTSVCRSVEEVQSECEFYRIPLRARISA